MASLRAGRECVGEVYRAGFDVCTSANGAVCLLDGCGGTGNRLCASQDLVNNGGAKPMSQILFDGLNPGGDPWTWNDTGWDSYNDEIYPRVPEPSTYGAILTAATLALLAYRKRKARQLANADKA